MNFASPYDAGAAGTSMAQMWQNRSNPGRRRQALQDGRGRLQTRIANSPLNCFTGGQQR